jgi:hypothetical protein
VPAVQPLFSSQSKIISSRLQEEVASASRERGGAGERSGHRTSRREAVERAHPPLRPGGRFVAVRICHRVLGDCP